MGHADELFKKAEMAIKKQNNEYAVELIMQGLIIEPDSPEWRRRLHKVATLVIQENGGNPAGGIGVKLKVLPHDGKAKKLRMQKKFDEEVIEIERSLKFQPENPGALMVLAKALENCELYESSISVYEEVTVIDSDNVEALRALGKARPENAAANYPQFLTPNRSVPFWPSPLSLILCAKPTPVSTVKRNNASQIQTHPGDGAVHALQAPTPGRHPVLSHG